MPSDRNDPPFDCAELADALDDAMDLLRCPCGRHRLTKDRVRAVATQLRETARPWNDPEMTFAMVSVVMAAMIWDKDPTDEHAKLLRQALRLCDDQLYRWNKK